MRRNKHAAVKASNMRVGVYIRDYVPESGGGFTFVSQIVQAFLKAGAGVVEHEFIILCNQTSLAALKKIAITGIKVEFCELPKQTLFERFLVAVRRYPLLLLLSRLYLKPSGFELMAKAQRIELIWFAGGGGYEIPDIPYVATVWDIQHRTHPWFPEVSALGEWEKCEISYEHFLKRATRIITGTETGAQQLGWYYQIPRDLIRILPHPAPDLQYEKDSFTSSAITEKFADRKYIFYPAQFWPHKNHANLLIALKVLEERLALKIELVLTGSDKGNRTHIVQLAQSLGLADRVHFLGFVQTTELVFLYRHALAMVYPSFSGPENLPPLEAFSHGCPVVIAEYPGAREQLGDAAVYFDPRLPEDIAGKLALLLGDDSLKELLIRNGRIRAASWTADHYVAGVMDIIKDFQSVRRCWSVSSI